MRDSVLDMVHSIQTRGELIPKVRDRINKLDLLITNLTRRQGIDLITNWWRNYGFSFTKWELINLIANELNQK